MVRAQAGVRIGTNMWGAVNLRSKPRSLERSEKQEKRIKAALAKHDRGEPLTEKEWTIVYWVRYSAGCHACGASSVGVAVRLPGDAG